jgi:FkbM family methyltransferase
MSNVMLVYQGINQLKSLKSSQEIVDSILLNIPVSKIEIETNGVYIFGVGKLGQRIFDFLSNVGITINGFIDNNSEKQKSKFNNLIVYSADKISNQAIVYIASATYFNPILNQLKTLGFTKLFSHSQAGILFLDSEKFPIEMYQENLTEDLFINRENYLKVFDLLDDSESKNVFDKLIQYRLSLNHKFIIEVHTSLSKEYYDKDVIELSENESFFDVGGFNGDSAENFIKYVKEQYKSVHIFEPDQALINQAKDRLNKYPNITFNSLGIYDKQTTLYFDITGGLDGIISDSGTLKIETTTIDDYKTEIPTYIKFDVEGVEIEAINGSVNTINDSKPKMAIASYHYPKHLWEIPLLVMNLNPTYKVRLRHYTDSVFDSIFYFI